jgi:hypothetical protein
VQAAQAAARRPEPRGPAEFPDTFRPAPKQRSTRKADIRGKGKGKDKGKGKGKSKPHATKVAGGGGSGCALPVGCLLLVGAAVAWGVRDPVGAAALRAVAKAALVGYGTRPATL